MNNRTMVKVSATENGLTFRTVSRSRKSPHAFYVTREELERLDRAGFIVVKDICSFATLQRDPDHRQVSIRFTWIGSADEKHLSGWEETVTLPYDGLLAFAARSREAPEGRSWSSLSIRPPERPQLIFKGSRNLRAALSQRTVRKKLTRFLRDNFKWRRDDKIVFYDDCEPYSFFFQTVCGGRKGICGGLILHGREDLSKAYYSIHT